MSKNQSLKPFTFVASIKERLEYLGCIDDDNFIYEVAMIQKKNQAVLGKSQGYNAMGLDFNLTS